jgi:hypothetical protein
MKGNKMSKPYIKLTTCDAGDWSILEMNCGEDFSYGGHSIPDFVWIDLLKQLGYEVEIECISDEEMEELC